MSRILILVILLTNNVLCCSIQEFSLEQCEDYRKKALESDELDPQSAILYFKSTLSYCDYLKPNETQDNYIFLQASQKLGNKNSEQDIYDLARLYLYYFKNKGFYSRYETDDRYFHKAKKLTISLFTAKEQSIRLRAYFFAWRYRFINYETLSTAAERGCEDAGAVRDKIYDDKLSQIMSPKSRKLVYRS